MVLVLRKLTRIPEAASRPAPLFRRRKLARNDPFPCRSGEKYKRRCARLTAMRRPTRAVYEPLTVQPAGAESLRLSPVPSLLAAVVRSSHSSLTHGHVSFETTGKLSRVM
jgi:hypothetical protein